MGLVMNESPEGIGKNGALKGRQMIFDQIGYSFTPVGLLLHVQGCFELAESGK
jgi:hypothetical protein